MVDNNQAEQIVDNAIMRAQAAMARNLAVDYFRQMEVMREANTIQGDMIQNLEALIEEVRAERDQSQDRGKTICSLFDTEDTTYDQLQPGLFLFDGVVMVKVGGSKDGAIQVSNGTWQPVGPEATVKPLTLF